jgi:hypothetical protein
MAKGVPPAPPPKAELVSEIVKLLNEAPHQGLVELRDNLRQKGYWEGLTEAPPAKPAVPEEEAPMETMIQRPKELPQEAPGRTTQVRQLQERLPGELAERGIEPPKPVQPPEPPTPEEARRMRAQEGRPPGMKEFVQKRPGRG